MALIKTGNCIVYSVYRYRWLLRELVVRDLKIKYRRSVLGYVWSVLNPLLTMLVLTVVFSHMFRFDIPNYPVYLLTGQLLFGFFSEATTRSMHSVLSGASLIKKVYLPKSIFPLSAVLSSFMTALFSLLALFAVMVVTDVAFPLTILLIPFILLYVLLFTIGVSLILAVASVYFRDMLHLYGVFLTLWMYLTPLFYPVGILPAWLRGWMALNPMYHFITMFRDVVLFGVFPSAFAHGICLLTAVCVFLLGLAVFARNENKLVLFI